MKKSFCLLAALALLLSAPAARASDVPKKYLALTFDDGPSGALTEMLLDGLAERQVHATFFVCGYRIEQFPDTLVRIASEGHEIGLHFDEMAYDGGSGENMIHRILREKDILSALLDTQVTTVSMHRPSKTTLEADWQIPDMVNSYGDEFFRGFKYLSDSHHHWREPVESIICTGEHDRLHILTHPFWYHDEEKSIAESVGAFIRSAQHERYQQMAENITDIDSIIKEENI